MDIILITSAQPPRPNSPVHIQLTFLFRLFEFIIPSSKHESLFGKYIFSCDNRGQIFNTTYVRLAVKRLRSFNILYTFYEVVANLFVSVRASSLRWAFVLHSNAFDRSDLPMILDDS